METENVGITEEKKEEANNFIEDIINKSLK